MSAFEYRPRISRRTTLRWVAGALAAAAFPVEAFGGYYIATAGGYGTDPNLVLSEAPWPRLLSPHELTQLAVLGDLILPGSAAHPTPSALGVPEFLDEWLSAPYPAQLKDRRIIREGLIFIDAECRQRGFADFLAAPAEQQGKLLQDRFAQGGALPQQPPQLFAERLRSLIVGGYFSTDEGAKEIGYTGNVALTVYPQPSAAMLAHIEAACVRAGI